MVNNNNNPVKNICNARAIGTISLRNILNAIGGHNAGERRNTEMCAILNLIEIIPTTRAKHEANDSQISKESMRSGSFREFYKGYKLNRHLGSNKDCMALRSIDNVIMGECIKRNTWSGNGDELKRTDAH